MRRIGLLAAILSLLLLAGLGMLVGKALDSVERERAMRHEVLSERVFDELEEQLTELTEREEARPFLQYRFFYVPEGQVTGNPSLSRSPLSELPEQDWLLGWFQLDPDGEITTPFEPEDETLASTVGWAQDDALAQRIQRLHEVAASVPVQPEDRREPPETVEAKDRQSAATPSKQPEEKVVSEPTPSAVRPVEEPVTTRKLDKADDGLVGLDSTRRGKKEAADPYGIGSLNKGAMRRGDRQQRVTKSSAENVRSYQYPADNQATWRGDSTLPEVDFKNDTEDAVAAVTDETSIAVASADADGIVTQDEDEELDDEAEEAEWAPEQRKKAKQSRRRNRAVPPPALSRPAAKQQAMSAPAVQATEPLEQAASGDERADFASVVETDGLALEAAGNAEANGGLLGAALDTNQDKLNGDDFALASGTPGAGGSGYRSNAPTTTPEDAQPLQQQSEKERSPDPDPIRRSSRRKVVQTPPPPPPTPTDAENGEVDVEISPFRGHRVDDETMLLYRTVRIGEVSYVQGLALLLPRLASWLEYEVLSGSELYPFLDLAWNGRAVTSFDEDTADFTFAHTFADPFTALAVTSYVRALPEPRGSGRTWILQLTALLLLVGSIGVFALWRMISVVVHFAERRSNFVAAVSHELKTPLTAIRMYAEMLRDGYVLSEEKRAEYYETMAAESERLSRLIQNVLELSRLEKGARSGGEIVTGDVRPVLEEAVRVLERHARDRGFTVVLDLPDELPVVRYDRDGLLQVLINLVDNGIKFSKDADPREVVIQAVPRGGGLTLQIRDHGPGVPPRQLSHIFQPFYRGERELTRRTKGTGIGLALVKGIVDGMGGSVSARNHPEGGFEVRVALVA